MIMHAIARCVSGFPEKRENDFFPTEAGVRNWSTGTKLRGSAKPSGQSFSLSNYC
jgi:hypothetical protein